MPNPDAIDQQQNLLAAYRATLAHYLLQRAQLGTAHASPGVTNGIAEARAGIAHCKATLRGWGVAVEDQPDDEEGVAHEPPPSGLPGQASPSSSDRAPASPTSTERDPPRPSATAARRGRARNLMWWTLLAGLLMLFVVIAAWRWPNLIRSSGTAPTTRALASAAPTPTSSPAAPPSPVAGASPTAGACPATISFGAAVRCAIDSAAEVDTFTFTAVVSDHLLISVAQAAGKLEPMIDVIDPEDTALSDCSGSDEDIVERTCVVSDSGTYTIHVADRYGGKGGAYRLYLQRLNNPGNATPLAPDTRATGTIAAVGQINTYSVPVTPSATLSIKMVRTSGDLEPWFALYQPNGTPINACTHDDPIRAEARCEELPAGTYTLVVASRYRGRVGNYSVFVTRAERSP